MPSLSRNFAIAISLLAATTCARADVVISYVPTYNMTCSAGVCSPTATNAWLNIHELENLLASGNVSVTTTGSGVQANNIRVGAQLAWSSANTLELDASNLITIDQPVSISGIAGLTTNSQNSMLSFGKLGNITFGNTSSTLIINGARYTLVNTVKSLAQAIAADPSGAFAMAASYDAAADGIYKFSPIQTTFFGAFEGLGNAISHLRIVDNFKSDSVGLFTAINGGLVTDLSEHITLQARAKGMFVGGLAGTMTGGSVANVSVTGKTIAQGGSRNGGLIGLNEGGSIANSFANVSVNGGEYVGGLVGQNSIGSNNSTITDSQAHGAVNSTSAGAEFVGGLVGYNDYLGSIAACYATGSVLGGPGSSAGGLVGTNDGGNASNSYASGAVTGGSSSEVGGLVGINSGQVKDTYSTGAPTNGGGGYVGGLAGTDDPPQVAQSYWDTDTSGITNLSQGAGSPANDPGITGLSTEQFQSGLPTGFDPGIWAEDSRTHNGLPFLIANPPK